MGSITTGIGLISGIDTASLIDSLIAIESRSKLTLQRRIASLQAQQTAILDINARLLSLKSTANSFRADSIFRSTFATSSNESVLTASAGSTAQPGTFNFIVKQLVSTSQKLSRGFIDADSTPVGLSSLDIAFGNGGLARDRELAELNGGNGVRAGKITVTDRAGGQATIDLTDTTTINEVLDRINNAADIAVTASVQGDRLVITDTSEGSGTLTIANAGTSQTATDLGIAGSAAGDTLLGSAVNTLGASSALGWLNDGTGVLIRNNNPDIRITTRDGVLHNIDFGRINALIDNETLLAELNNGDGVPLSDSSENMDLKIVARDGTEYEVNLTGVTTVGGLINRISSQTSGHIQLSVTDGTRFSITDTVGGSGDLRVLGAGDNGNATAEALGILNETGASADSFAGEVIPNTIMQPPANTLGEIVARINDQSGGSITASINAATGALDITDNTGGSGNLIIRSTAANEFAATQLGIATGDAGVAANQVNGQRLIAHLGSVLLRNLNGGAGLGDDTSLQITDRDGQTLSLANIGQVHSLSQVIDAINARAEMFNVGVTVAMNNAGTGLIVNDTTGGSDSNLIISGALATALNIEGNVADSTVRGENLNHKYVGVASRLSDLNYGRGIGSGSFRITDGFGKTATINVGSAQSTLQDVIQAINAQAGPQGLAVRARLNDDGDGLLIEQNLEHAGGATPFVALRVDSISGTTAKDLNILGKSSTVSDAFIDGGYGRTIEFSETDTLSDIVRKINESGVPVSASVINTGSGANPYRLNFTSNISGRLGELILDSGNFDLGLTTLSKGQDAKIYFGGGDGSGGEGFLVTSRSNTVRNVVPGVTLDLKSVSEDPVSVTVARDDARILEAVEKFVNNFNEVIDRIDHYDFFDTESEERGVLLGNPTSARIRSALQRTVQQRAEGIDSQYQYLREVGIRIGAGGKLTFDQERFTQAWENDPAAVENLFASYETTSTPPQEIMPGITVQGGSSTTTTQRGLGDIFNDLLNDMTDSVNGTVTVADNNFKSLIKLSQDRISAMDIRLGRKREQLERQFAAMESALAMLQGQSNALMGLNSNLALARNTGQ